MEAMGNLFDVAVLIGVGFLIMALSSFGLNELIGKDDVTIVKNPGTSKMTMIRRQNGKIERLKSSDQQAQGQGAAIGTVYRLSDGRVIWSPNSPAPTGNGQ